jgi:hypothetical protein
MALRCTLEIIPFGDENHARTIRVFDISNDGTVHRGAFGNDLCAYWVKVFDPKVSELSADSFETEFPLPELHNRRDGAEVLVMKVLETYESGWRVEED